MYVALVDDFTIQLGLIYNIVVWIDVAVQNTINIYF